MRQRKDYLGSTRVDMIEIETRLYQCKHLDRKAGQGVGRVHNSTWNAFDVITEHWASASILVAPFSFFKFTPAFTSFWVLFLSKIL